MAGVHCKFFLEMSQRRRVALAYFFGEQAPQGSYQVGFLAHVQSLTEIFHMLA